jgi:hypothetical protein
MMKVEESKSEWGYPRTYRIDQSTCRFFEGLAFFLVVLFSIATCLQLMRVFARPLSHRDLAWIDLSVALFALWCVWWAKRLVVLDEQSIEMTGWFWKRKLRRDEISGIRMGHLPYTYGGSSYYIVVAADRSKKNLNLPPFLHTDQQFQSWIQTLPQLNIEH